MARLDYFLRLVGARRAPGLRLRAGSAPILVTPRGDEVLALPPFTGAQLRDFVREITTTEDLAELTTRGVATLHYEYEGAIYACELRATQGQIEAEFRLVPSEPEPEAARAPGKALELLREARPPEPPRPQESRPTAPDDYLDDDDTGELPALPAHGPASIGPSMGVPSMQLRSGSGQQEPRPESRPDARPEGRGEGRAEARSEARPPRAPAFEPQPSEAPVGGGGLRPGVSIHYTRSEATMPPALSNRLNKEEMHKLLRWMVEQDATDMHITPRFPPTLRVDNLFQPSQGRLFSPEEIEKVIFTMLNSAERATFEKNHAVDLSYHVEGLGRFRINVFRQMHGVSAAVRYIRSAVESFDRLNLPEELTWLTGQETGLVLFTGPTGSGKSTAMAAVIEQMNKTRQLHILTLEQPIEFIFDNKSCLIQQREVRQHTPAFLDGLRDAMRENPDVIMVGELRDLETVQMAIAAAETGHLILATMHANTTTNAVSRLIEVFPDNQKAGARAMLSDTLSAVVNLRLMRHISGKGLLPCVEFLKNTHAVATLIRENKLHQIKQVITTAGGDGMWLFEKYLVDRYRKGDIDYETAYATSPDKTIFETYMASTEPKDTAAKRKKPLPTPSPAKLSS